MCKSSSDESCAKKISQALKSQCSNLNTNVKESQTNLGLISVGFENASTEPNNCEDGWRVLEIICVIWLCVMVLLSMVRDLETQTRNAESL